LYTYGIVNVDEARQLLREYDVNIPENELLDQPESDENNIEETPIVEGKNHVRKPTDEEIQIAQRLRELGEKEMVEQEKRVGKKF
jgi:hypothetical protein